MSGANSFVWLAQVALQNNVPLNLAGPTGFTLLRVVFGETGEAGHLCV